MRTRVQCCWTSPASSDGSMGRDGGWRRQRRVGRERGRLHLSGAHQDLFRREAGLRCTHGLTYWWPQAPFTWAGCFVRRGGWSALWARPHTPVRIPFHKAGDWLQPCLSVSPWKAVSAIAAPWNSLPVQTAVWNLASSLRLMLDALPPCFGFC